MSFVKSLDAEINHNICTFLKSKSDIETASVEDLIEHIKNMLAGNSAYQILSKLDYKFEFIDFIKSTNLELDEKKSRF